MLVILVVMRFDSVSVTTKMAWHLADPSIDKNLEIIEERTT